MHDDEIVRVREALACLYGAVAAVMRGDDVGASILLGDLRGCFDGLEDLLVAISVATLERLEAAVAAGPVIEPSQGRPIAHELLSVAHAYDIAQRDAVQYAAWRLDAVRQGDLHQVMLDVAGSRAIASDDDLVLGAAALLAATVVLWARRTGQLPAHAVVDLCLAASLDVTA